MHVLDSYINDIEPRIRAVCNNSPKQEDAALQEALASYGWILLDSWIAWRTLRFLIRDVYLDENVQKKWIQTPSSYTCNQLRAAWKFNDLVLDRFEMETGNNLKTVVDKTIQEKRNASAHFSKKSIIQGRDTVEIEKLFITLSKLFLFYEVSSFLKDICVILNRDRYMNFKAQFKDSTGFTIKESAVDEFEQSYDEYLNCDSYMLSCVNSDDIVCEIHFMKTGCDAIVRVEDESESFSRVNICNNDHDYYNFFSNKGYYRDKKLFVSTVENSWNKIILKTIES